MDEDRALSAFAALSQATRLRIVRLLVVAGGQGLPAGAIAGRLGTAASTMSFHLKELEGAGLLRSRREGRSILYAAEFDALSGLGRFLMEDCCAGRPEAREPALSAATGQGGRP